MLEFLFNLNIIVALLRRIDRKQDELMSTVTEAFSNLAGQANKAFGEISGKISDLSGKIEQLTAALANRELTPEETAALEEVKTAVQKLDDIVPDDLPTEPPVETQG
jgi:methyl-accepting chemotaxis protein